MRALPLLLALATSAACAAIDQTSEEAFDREYADPMSIEEIIAGAEALDGEWVTVRGRLTDGFEPSVCVALDPVEEGVCAPEHLAIGVRVSELAARIPRQAFGGEVEVTGEVDPRCYLGWLDVEEERKANPDKIIWLSGYCHYSIDIHLDHAVVTTVEDAP